MSPGAKHLNTRISHVQRPMTLEKQMIDCCEERFQISQALPQCFDSKSRLRHENRMLELYMEIGALWGEYRKLTY